MTIDELADLTKDGFAGVHSRLDALNGRTRRNEVGIGQLNIQAGHLETGLHEADSRLRSVETEAAVSTATLDDLRKAGRKAGIQWGSIAGAAVGVLTYLAHFLLGVPLPH